jgi:predicted CopG family antitoxin
MATRTISLKEEAYNRLRGARRYAGESFSEVVLRATWPEDTTTAAKLLTALRTRREHLEADELDRLEAMRAAAEPPEDKWTAR